MRIAFDASTIFGYSGINTYSRRLISTLAHEYPDDRFILLSTFSKSRERRLKAMFGDAANITVKRALLNPIALGPSLRWLTFLQRGLALGMTARKVDVLHLTQPYRERIRGSNIVITAHDLFPLVLDDYSREAVLGEFRKNAATMLGRARAAIVYTEFIRRQIESVFPGVVRDVSIIPAAADELFSPSCEEPFMQLPVGSRPNPSCFFYVGSAYPRKNLPRVLESYLGLPEGVRREHPLVFILTGAKLHRDEFGSSLGRLPEDASVYLLDPVTDEELVRIYSSASALVFPSLGEGFGLPVLEAMRCGCPVITSSTSCLPEVAGDAALLVDPEDPGAITAAMARIVSEEGLAEELRRRGLEHSRKFSWSRTAQMTMDVYRKIGDSIPFSLLPRQ